MIKPTNILNNLTMYRVIIYGLLIIIGFAFIDSTLKQLSFSPLALLCTLGASLVGAFVSHSVLKRVFNVSTSNESWLITALILFLILRPSSSLAGISVVALGAVIAIASKYIITHHDRHIFNPVAFALVALGLLGSGEIFWWVGSAVLLPVVVLVGVTVAFKTQKIVMIALFIASSLISTVVFAANTQTSTSDVSQALLSGPLIFFACLMFSEPLTSPTTRKARLVFAVLVGLLYGANIRLGLVHTSPEVALVIGNLFAYCISRPRRLKMQLVSSCFLGTHVYEFTFKPNQKPKFKSGQYLELTLPHENIDSRGNRRFFSIASSPQEGTIKIAIRIDPDHNSSFKRALMGLKPGDTAWAAAVGGDFVLDSKPSKLVFIAGGIGVTPFRSIIKNMVDIKTKQQATLFYFAEQATDFCYQDDFKAAEEYGLKTVYCITRGTAPDGWSGKIGHISKELLLDCLGDTADTKFYISGPPAMVKATKKVVRSVGIKPWHIKTDYFAGY